MEMPKATFDKRVSGARLLSFENGVFTIGVTDAFTRDWLEDRLTRLIERQLVGIINTDTHVRFVVEETERTKQDTNELPESSADVSFLDENIDNAQSIEETFRPIQTDLHKIISRPHAQTVVPAYLLRWLPYVGPAGGWFLIAMYQAFYFSANARVSRENLGTLFRVNRNWLRSWSGLGTNKIASLLESTSQTSSTHFINWFIKGSKPAKGQAREYCFRIDMPLTPGDIEFLTKWLVDNGIRDNPIVTLEKAINTPSRDILPYPVPPPATHHYGLAPNSTTVLELVHTLSGKKRNTKNRHQITELARQLQTNILHPNDNLHITHYFLRNWVKPLKPGPAWVVIILRDRGFQDTERGILRDKVRLQNGYQELSSVLGVSEERISDWLPPLEDRVRRKGGNSPKRSWRYQQKNRQQIENFILSKTGDFDTSGSQATKYVFRIRLDDPLIPEHAKIAFLIETILWQRIQTGNEAIVNDLLSILNEAIDAKRAGVEFKQLIKKPVEDLGVENKQRENDLKWNLNSVVSGWSGFRAGQDEPEVKIKQLSEWTPRDIKASLIKSFNIRVLYEIHQLLLQTGSMPTEEEPNKVVGGWTVNLAMQILTSGGIQPNKCRHFQSLLEKHPEKLSHLIGWLLYGYANRTNNDRRGIDAPELYAVSRFEKSAPQPVYLELVEKPVAELVRLLQYPYSRQLPKNHGRILSKANENGFLDVLKALGVHQILASTRTR